MVPDRRDGLKGRVALVLFLGVSRTVQSGDLCVVIQRHKNRLAPFLRPPCLEVRVEGISDPLARRGEPWRGELKGLGEG